MEFNDDTYYDYPAVSASGINLMLISPFVYWKHSPYNPDKIPDQDSDEKLLGRLTHILVLESRSLLDERYLIIPEGMRRDKRTQVYQELMQEAQTNDQILVPYNVVCEAEELAENLLLNPIARQIMQECTFESPALVEKDGLKCKIKRDMRRNGLIIDYKTTTAITKAAYWKSCADYGYHRAAAWYLDIDEIERGERARGFMHIVQNKKYKDLIGFPVFTEEMIKLGTVENDFAFAEIKQRLQSGNWAEWPQKIISAEFPDWYKVKGEWSNADTGN